MTIFFKDGTVKYIKTANTVKTCFGDTCLSFEYQKNSESIMICIVPIDVIKYIENDNKNLSEEINKIKYGE